MREHFGDQPDPSEPNKVPKSVAEIIDEAMRYGYAVHLRNLEPNQEVSEEMLAKLTAEDCYQSCSRVLHYLSTCGIQFRRLFLLESVINPSKTETRFSRDFYLHFAWCAEDLDGNVYIGSPNNADPKFIRETGKDPLKTIHKGSF